MPLGITSYVDPGVYIKERIQPGSVSVNSERVLAIVGIAPRTRRSEDEAVIRGKVFDETLTVAGTAPHTAYLVDVCNRDRNNATLYRNGQALGLGDWSFNAATIHSTAWAAGSVTFTAITGDYLVISLDGKAPIAINFVAGSTTAANVCVAINAALVASPTYGATYSAVATTDGGSTPTITLTSPTTNSTTDIRLYHYITTGIDANSKIGGTAWLHIHGGTAGLPTSTSGVQALPLLTLNTSLYSSTSTYTIDYVSTTTLTDPLEQAITTTQDLEAIVRVGSYPGSSTYANGVDYDEDTGNDVITWDTSVDAQAYYTGTVDGSASISLGTARNLKFSINGAAAITVTLSTGVPTPTSANVVTDINAALVASSSYGPAYGYVASVDSAKYVKLTVPKLFEDWTHGEASIITFYTATTLDASTAVFGLNTATFPKDVVGVASRPSFGSVYYTTYDYERPAVDYTSITRVYNPDQLYAYTSPLTLDNYPVNKLAIAGEIAFENGATSLYLVQVNDSTVPGTPTLTQIKDAIDVAEESTVLTDMVVVGVPAVSEEPIAVYLMQHVSNMSSILNKKYRRGWFGMPRGTSVGDPDTADTFVYRSSRTLQPGNTSPGRGRLILTAPSEMDRVITLDDGREVTLELDGSYAATAVAALFTSLPSPSDALLGRQITGFLTDSTYETYLQGERYTLAGNGVNVVTLDAGRLILLDPLTTEAGGGKVIQFEEPSSSAQKDSVTRAVASILDNNCKGVVPDDMAAFLLDIKLWIAKAVRAQISAGVIAPFRNANGSSRDIDLTSDIQVYQDEADPRSFIFRYWFNLKYVAKRFFGEYSVDNPFFG